MVSEGKKIRRNRNRIKRGTLSSDDRKRIRKELVEKYNGICQVCFIQTNPDDYVQVGPMSRLLGKTYPTIEHINSAAETRDWSIENLTLACHDCNNRRRPNEPFTVKTNNNRKWVFE